MRAVPRVLDTCCGSRMMYFDRTAPGVLFGDKRHETITVPDRSHGKADGTRTIHIHPDAQMDFRALPCPPLFGNASGKKAGTHWMCFLKQENRHE